MKNELVWKDWRQNNCFTSVLPPWNALLFGFQVTIISRFSSYLSCHSCCSLLPAPLTLENPMAVLGLLFSILLLNLTPSFDLKYNLCWQFQIFITRGTSTLNSKFILWISHKLCLLSGMFFSDKFILFLLFISLNLCLNVTFSLRSSLTS